MTEPHKFMALYERTGWIIARQTDGLTHADSLLQLPFRANCLNWVLGHIAVYRDKALERLGEAPYLNERETGLYLRESEPLTDADAGAAVPLERLLAVLNQQQERIAAALAATDAATLEAFADAEQKRTVGDRLEFAHWHETYHVGQLEILRQLAGKDDAII